MLVPLVEFDEVASGVAVGRVVEEHSDDVIHSGALGSYASLELMFKNTMFIGVILYGIVLAFASFLLQSIKSPFIKFIMFFFFSNFLLVATMSGNFDFSISLLLLKLALFKVYFYPVFSFNKAWRTQMSH